jgi:chitinase
MRWRAVPLVALATVVLAGCGGSASTSSKVTSAKDRVVVGYYADWDRYARGFPIYLPLSATAAKRIVDAEHITHLDYAFAKIVDNFSLGKDKKLEHHYAVAQVDDTMDPLNFPDLLRLKKEFPKLKTLIAIGGWTLSDKFSPAIKDDAGRTSITKSAVDYMKKNGFDGIDLDWEFPVCCGSETGQRYLDLNQSSEPRYSPDDRHNFTLWLKELRHQLDDLGKKDGKHYLLTIAASAAPDVAAKAYEIKDVARIVDWIDVMGYDFHVPVTQVANLSAPLTQNPADPDKAKGYTASAAIAFYEKSGAPPSKLVLGVPFYGHGWADCPPQNHGEFQTCKGDATHGGTWVKLDANAWGEWDYWDLKKSYVNKNGFVRYWDAKSQVPFLYNAKTGTWISYDDDQSIAAKAKYVIDQGLKGGMFWEMAMDKNSGLEKTLYDTVMQQSSAGSAAGK